MSSQAPQSSNSSLTTVKTILVNTANEGQDALFSGCWSYPFLGIAYLLRHPSLLKVVAPFLLKFSLLSAGITAAMFMFTYLPQVAFCALFSGPLAFIAAVPLVLGESYAIINFFAKALFLSRAQDEIFDAVLLQQGNAELVSRGRMVVTSGSTGIKKLGKSLTKPLDRFNKENLMIYVLSLPLNAIPAVGTALFLLVNGAKAGPAAHGRYFQLKGYDKDRRASFVKRRKGPYTAFGAAAVGLNLVPVANFLFTFTSTIGAALWASQLENKGEVEKPKDVPVQAHEEVKLEL